MTMTMTVNGNSRRDTSQKDISTGISMGISTDTHNGIGIENPSDYNHDYNGQVQP